MSTPMPLKAGGAEARRRYWLSPVIGLALLTGLAFLAIGIRAVLAPTAMSTAFGLPMVTENEIAFVQVYGSRTILLAALALVFLLQRNLRSLALLLTLAAPLPLFDAGLLALRHGVGLELFRHAGYLALLIALAALLWRKLRKEAAEATH